MSDDPVDALKDYLNKITDLEDDCCWLCGKTLDQIRSEYFEYMKHPSEEFADLTLDELVIMTYKTQKPICAGCYFSIKENAELVKEILDRPQEDVW